MVLQELVLPESILEGDVATIRCAHSDTVLYPLAKVKMEVNGIPIEVEAAISDTLPVSVLLGGDVPQLKQLLSISAVINPPQLSIQVTLWWLSLECKLSSSWRRK